MAFQLVRLVRVLSVKASMTPEATGQDLACNSLQPSIRPYFHCVQPKPYGQDTSVVHHSVFFLGSTCVRKSVVAVVIDPITLAITIAMSATVSTIARAVRILKGADMLV